LDVRLLVFAWETVRSFFSIGSIGLGDSRLTMEPHDILLILLVVNHLRPFNDLTIRDIRPSLRREDMAHSFPRDEVAAAVAVDADEARNQNNRQSRLPCHHQHTGRRSTTYLPLLVNPVLSSPNQYQSLSSELALWSIAPPWAWIRVPEVSVMLSLG
jgi:hypothetical protein